MGAVLFFFSKGRIFGTKVFPFTIFCTIFIVAATIEKPTVIVFVKAERGQGGFLFYCFGAGGHLLINFLIFGVSVYRGGVASNNRLFFSFFRAFSAPQRKRETGVLSG